MIRRSILFLAASLAVTGSVIAQTSFPSGPVRVVIPYPPGGGNDSMGRLVAQKLGELLGVATIVENRGGANGAIGSDVVARAAPDGQTILVNTIGSHLLAPLLAKTPYDPVKDFVPIGTIDSSDYVLAVSSTLPVKSLKEFVELAKAKPGEVSYGSSAVAIHLNTALFAERVGIKLQHIPYKGAGGAVVDVIGGRVNMFMSSPASIVANVKGGKLKALAVTSETRNPLLPDVPTFAEAGYPEFNVRDLRFPQHGIADFDIRTLRGLFVPRGTPKPIVDRLSQELRKIIEMPDVKESMAASGYSPLFMAPEQVTRRMQVDYVNFAKAVKLTNISGDR